MKDLKPNTYFLICAPFVGLVAACSFAFPLQVSSFFTLAGKVIYTLLDWFIIWTPLAVFICCMYLAFSFFGKKRLASTKDERPEYGLFSWCSMLFTAGMGVGIIFYGPLEAIWHMEYGNYSNLLGITQSEKANFAMSTTVWLWGVSAWSFYTISAVVVAYFAYNKKASFKTSAPILFAFKKHKWAKPVSYLTMCFTIITVGISLAATLAMAAGQVNGGLRYILNKQDLQISTYILLGFFILSILVALTPINKGMKRLADFTMILAILLLAFIFITGPSRYFMMTFIQSIGNSITGTLTQSFNLFIFDKSRYWLNWFAMSYFIWWVGWTPFMGVFIAKVSKGRTYKQMILCSILVPAGFILVWFSVFSGYGLLDTLQGKGVLLKVASSNYQDSMYALLDLFPLSFLTKPLLAVLFIGFVITTIVSGCITLGILTGKDGKNPSKLKVFIWGAFMSMIALPFVLSGKIEGIKAIGSLAGFPYFFCYFLLIAALLKCIRLEKKEDACKL